MRLKIYLGLIAAAFLFISYWFIMHSYVFVKLSAVLTFILLVCLAAAVIALLGRVGGSRG